MSKVLCLVPHLFLLDNRTRRRTKRALVTMKCPKCNYLGFDTGDRCRNCGYDFSFLPTSSAPIASATDSPLEPMLPTEPDLPLQPLQGVDIDRLADVPLEQLAVAGLDAASSAPVGRQSRRSEPLPLFGEEHGIKPLVRFPSAPRAPLAVRKNPEIPRLKPLAALRKVEEARAAEPRLELPAPSVAVAVPAASRPAAPPAESCTLSARLTAVGLDLGLLLTIDLLVFYFTLRMAALAPDEWRLLPLSPFFAFLFLIKLAYYWAFTVIGGQTIGKMAMHIRVIADGGSAVAPATAFQRTLIATISVLTLGATFLPALLAVDRRAMHDRVARTRVVTLPGA